MKTLKEIADFFGVKKDKVKYEAKKLPSKYLVKKNNITYINDKGIKELEKILVGKSPSEKVGNSLQDSPLKKTIELLEKQLEQQSEQLKVKDNQIESLLEKLDQEQRLNLANVHEKQQLQIELKEKNKSIFNRIFKKGE